MKTNRHSIIVTTILIGLVVLMASCFRSKSSPGWTYMPDMAYSRAYESYMTNMFYPDSMNARKPVKNTIPRGDYMPFHYANTPDDYKRAGEDIKNPLEMSKEVIAKGQHNYLIYCAICHGETGEANGTIVKNGKFPPPPSYFSDNILRLPEGSRYFSVHFGKNLMGSYATQLSQTQIWEVLTYIKSMQMDYLSKNPKVDSAMKAENKSIVATTATVKKSSKNK